MIDRLICAISVFWLVTLSMLWLSGCTPAGVRCVVEPSAEQWRWMTEVTERSNDHELRLKELEQWKGEHDAI